MIGFAQAFFDERLSGGFLVLQPDSRRLCAGFPRGFIPGLEILRALEGSRGRSAMSQLELGGRNISALRRRPPVDVGQLPGAPGHERIVSDAETRAVNFNAMRLFHK